MKTTRPNQIMDHERRADIEYWLAAGTPYRAICAEFGVNKDALTRHRKRLEDEGRWERLVEDATVGNRRNDLEALQVKEGESLLENLVNVRARLFRLMDEAEGRNDTVGASSIAARIHQNLKLVGDLLAQFPDKNINHRHVHVALVAHEEYPKLRALLVHALASYPEARSAVAHALQSVEATSSHRDTGEASPAPSLPSFPGPSGPVASC